MGLWFFAENIASGAQVVENAQVLSTGMDSQVLQNEFMNNQAINWFFQINWPLMLSLFLFYFIGGYFLYASLFAAIGAAVDNDTDTQQFMMPITMPLVFSLIYSQSMIGTNPDGLLTTILSMLPFRPTTINPVS